ncbi:MAG TPA: endonuclease/exonuclease/phosphatase family protein [Pirellulales bacterium]|nr:endonuclease/exonuclease/phosphatase family protein [Pirellulales bacterium]
MTIAKAKATSTELCRGAASVGPAFRRGSIERLAGWLAWAYAVGVIVAWLVLRIGGDRWWWTTALLFAPRWAWPLPVTVILPVVLLWRRRLAWLVALSALWVAWPLMGFCVPWQRMASAVASSDAGGYPPVRVLTCNLGVNQLLPGALETLIADERPDVITLQEKFDEEGLRRLLGPSWQVEVTPGILVATQFPIVGRKIFTGSEAVAWRTVAIDYRMETPSGPIDFVAVHLYTPRKGLEAIKDRHLAGIDGMRDNLARRDRESADLRRWIDTLEGPVILAGDMNLPDESAIFRRDWSDFSDAFGAAGLGYGYTYGYTTSGKWYGIRIDHILAGAGFRVERAWVGPHVGSDHRPVLAVLEQNASNEF